MQKCAKRVDLEQLPHDEYLLPQFGVDASINEPSRFVTTTSHLTITTPVHLFTAQVLRMTVVRKRVLYFAGGVA